MLAPPHKLSLETQFLPAHRWSPGTRSPYLCLVLHGRGDSLESFDEIDKELKIDGMNYLLVNAPRKLDEGYSWYSLYKNTGRGILRSKLRLLSLIEELQSLGWRSDNIFMMGHSQGALMTQEIAMTSKQLFAGFVASAGYMHIFDDWKRRLDSNVYLQNWLATHGTKDKDIPLAEAWGDVSRLKDLDIPIEWKVFEKDHFFEHDEELNFIASWMRRKMAHQLVSGPRNRRAQVYRETSRRPDAVL